jgi:hypothetical protein
MLMGAGARLKDYHLFDVNGSREMVEEYINLLWKLAKIYNNYCKPNEIIDIPSRLKEES